VSTLAPPDSLILLAYCFFALAASLWLKSSITGSSKFLQAGRELPAWVCGLAFVAAGLGLQAPAAMGLMGARYGFESVAFTVMGGVPAMLFLGLFMMPLYHGSKARTVPEYLGLRFDEKTRVLNACLFLVSAVTGAALSLYAMARVFEALHVFDVPTRSMGLESGGAFVLLVAVPAALVLAYLLLGGLAGAIYNQAMQFFVVVAGFLPVVFLGLKQIGGWDGLKAAAASAGSSYSHAWNGNGHGGIASFGVAVGLGLVFGVAFWCADFRVVQAPMAAKDAESARKAPLVGAAAWLVFPLLLILPGIIALGMPTPHTTVVVRNENGAIFHEITVVPAADEAGQGLVPAVMEPATGKPIERADGHNLLDYAQAAPNVLVHFLPMGLLGLGIAALLACMMASVAAGIAAFNAVFTGDLYQAHIHKSASDGHLMAVGRWAALGAMLLAVGVACAAFRWGWKLDTMAVMFARLNAPLLAMILLGMFCKRITAHGAFAGLASGVVIAALPSVILLPGLRIGWIADLRSFNYRIETALGFWAAIAGVAVTLLVGTAVSLGTKPRPDLELADLVHSLRARGPANATWWKRPEAIAAVILMAAIGVTLIFI
jgi:solute:Na+ symporter, SSS family